VRRFEPFQHVALARQPWLDLEPRRHLESLERVVVTGIGHGHGEGAIVLRERQYLRAAEILEIQLAPRHVLGRELASGDAWDAEIGGEQRLEILLRDEPEVEQQTLDALATLLLELPDLAQIVRTDAPLVQEELLETTVLELHERPNRIP